MTNPYLGVWARKSSRIEDSWGVRYDETYWSSHGDWDDADEVLTLHRKDHLGQVVGLKLKFILERFNFLGVGDNGWG